MKVNRWRRLTVASLLIGSLLGIPWVALASPPIPDLPVKPEFDDSAPLTTSADGSFAFPLLVNQEDIIAGLGGTNTEDRWHYWLSAGDHHDYPAADILVSTGTPIVAPMPGVVVDSGSLSGAHNFWAKVQVAPSRCFLFLHMLPGTLAVSTGEEVAQGQLIGRVGTAADAVAVRTGSGTIPHLHFEITNCASSRGKTREDPQPMLVEVFERLPHRGPPPPPPAPPIPPPPPMPEPNPMLERVQAGPPPTPVAAPVAAPTTVAPVATTPVAIPPPPPIPPPLSVLPEGAAIAP